MLNVELDHILDEANAEADIQKIIQDVENNNEVYVVNKDGKPAVAIVSVERFIKYGQSSEAMGDSDSENSSMNNDRTEDNNDATNQNSLDEPPNIETKTEPEGIEISVNSNTNETTQEEPTQENPEPTELPDMPSFDEASNESEANQNSELEASQNTEPNFEQNNPNDIPKNEDLGYKFNLPPLSIDRPATQDINDQDASTPPSAQVSSPPRGVFGEVTITPKYNTGLNQLSPQSSSQPNPQINQQPTNPQVNQQPNPQPAQEEVAPKIFNLSPLGQPPVSPNMTAIPPKPIQVNNQNPPNGQQYNPDGTPVELDENGNPKPQSPQQTIQAAQSLPHFTNPKVIPHPDALIENNSDPSNSSPLA